MKLSELNAELERMDCGMGARYPLPGVAPRIPIEAYHRAVGHSSSGLKHAARTLAHYNQYRKKPPKPPTPAQMLGTATHMAVLEPDRFADGKDIAIIDDTRTKVGKMKKEEALEKGQTILTTERFEKASAMREAVLDHPLGEQIFQGGMAEVSVFYKRPDGLLIKARPDYLQVKGKTPVIVDLKTFGKDLDEWALEWQIYRLKYHWQSAFHLDVVNGAYGTESSLFYHVFVEEPDDPDDYIGVRIGCLNDAALEKAREEFYPLLDKIREAELTGEWPGHPVEAIDLSLPDKVW